MIFIKKIISSLLLLAVCLFSFYYTNKIALYVKNKNPLMQQIKSRYEDTYLMPVNSTIIDDTYIIPGLSGKKLNIDSTFFNMQKKGIYDEEKFVFTLIKPNISLEDNKDKIIIRGNKNNNAVSLIVESINPVSKYLKQNSYQVNLLVSEEVYDLYYELINDSNIEETYNNIDSFLDKHRANNYLCLVKNDKVPKLCQDKYLIKPSLTISHSNIFSIKNKISSGEIILIKDSVTLTDLVIILNEIKYHDLTIKPLSSLIKE